MGSGLTEVVRVFTATRAIDSLLAFFQGTRLGEVRELKKEGELKKQGTPLKGKAGIQRNFQSQEFLSNDDHYCTGHRKGGVANKQTRRALNSGRPYVSVSP